MGLISGLKSAIYSIARGVSLTDPRLSAWLGGGESDAGEIVTVDMAMQLDVVWACVRRISETVATLPLHFYEAGADGIGKIRRDHPLYPILHDRPNADMTAVNFWEAMVGCYLLWGNAYAQIARGSAGRIVALLPMRPDFVQVFRDDVGGIGYRYTFAGQVQVFGEDEVFHIKGFSLDGMMGLSPVAQARQTLGTVRATQRSSASMFRNGLRPSGFLKAPTYLNKQQRDDSKILMQNFSGASNTGKVPLLEGGWTFEQMSIPPEDAQMLQTQILQVEQICRWYDVPPVLVGHSAQTTWGSGIEQIMLGWLTLGLRSHLERVEQAIAHRLLTNVERANGFYAEFNVDGLLRGDSKARAEQMATLATNGLRTRNELRALDNMPPKSGGDDLTVNAALIPVQYLGEIAKLPRDKIVEPGAAVGLPSGVAALDPPSDIPGART